jgi:hypothetical protein
MKKFITIFITLTIIISACRKSENNTPLNSEFSLDWIQTETWMNIDGWTNFAPSEDTRIMYVAENGNDATAKYYAATDNEIGSDPFNPSGNINAYASYDAAAANARFGFPDWILFKRGDSFKAQLLPKAGRSENEYSLIAAYGSSGNMPIIKPIDENTCVVKVFARRAEKDMFYSAISSLDFYADTRDPASANYVSAAGNRGLSVLALGIGDDEKGHIKRFLVEGCRFMFFDGNVVQAIDDGAISEFIVYRSVFLNSYSDGEGHCQGLYAHNINSILLKENIFDHNGWLNQAPTQPGPATMFNHNTYFTDCRKVNFSDNIFLRSSSIHNKFTGMNINGPTTTDVAILNNVYVDGEIGVSMGGNETGPGRFENIAINGNVLTEIGRSQPTNRTLGWGIDIIGWNNGQVKDNCMIFNNLGISNVWAYRIGADVKNTEIANNVAYDINGTGLYINPENTQIENVKAYNNILHDVRNESGIVKIRSGSIQGITLSDNTYYKELDKPFEIEGKDYTLEDWQAATGDNSTFSDYQFTDATRSIETYQSSIGGAATIDAFIEACRAQNRYNWNEDYTAPKVGEWIKAGFAN